MEFLFAYAVGVAAVWRMTIDFSSSRELDGPFSLYAAIRRHVNNRGYPEWVKEGIGCVWCSSFWFGAMFAPFYCLAGLCSWWFLPIMIPALSGPVSWYFSRVELMFPDTMARDL